MATHFLRDLEPLFDPKSDDGPIETPTNDVSGSDLNKLKKANEDIRESFNNGELIENPAGPTSVAPAGRIRHRVSEGRVQLSEDGRYFKSTLPGVNVHDIRDLGTGGVLTGNSDKDTQALLAAVALLSAGSTSASPKGAQVKFPRGTYLCETTLSPYGANSDACAWIGAEGQGKSRGPNGTVIQWAGPAKGVMWHGFGLNAGLIKDIAFDGNGVSGRARICMWNETNQRNGGSISSGMKFESCYVTGWGHLGFGVVNGDEVRGDLVLTGVTGTFHVGDFIINGQYDSIATVMGVSGSTLTIKEVMGTFATPSAPVVGYNSTTSAVTGTGTISSWTVDPAYQGNLEFSEATWEDFQFQATQVVDDLSRAAWCCWGNFGGNNNKNYILKSPKFDGARYGVDWNAGSGFLTITDPTGGNLGHHEKGALIRASGGTLDWQHGDFENGGADYRARMFDLSNIYATITTAEFLGLLPADNKAIKMGFGSLTMAAVKLGSDSGSPTLIEFSGGALNLFGVGWREDFTGYIPVVDSSGNKLGQQSGGDSARNTEYGLFARGCIANSGGGASGIRNLPFIDGRRPVTPYDQAQTNDTTSGVLIVANTTGHFVCDVPYTVLQTQQAPVLCRLPEGLILSVQAKVTVALAGATGLAFSVGRDASGFSATSLLLSQSAMSVDKFGDSDADLGADLAKSVRDSAGTGTTLVRTFCSTTTGVDYIKLQLTKTGGSFASLSLGNIRVVIEWRRFG